MPIHRLTSLTLGALAAVAIVPAAASAAQRYAGPAGAGSSCTAAAPCSITTAVGGAIAGDEVTVLPGDYPLTATLQPPAKITIHGVAGQPRPRLQFSGGSQFGVRIPNGSTLRYLEVDQSDQAYAVWLDPGFADQVILRGSAQIATANIFGSTIRDSIITSAGTNSPAVLSDPNGAVVTNVLRNDTIVATGTGGTAVKVQADGATGSATINLFNTIARGLNGASLQVVTDNSGAHATINPVYTNYGAFIITGTNAVIGNGPGYQGFAPVFADPAAGDFREAANSPTIGAGQNDPLNGDFDVDGGARIVGTTDIGAGEFSLPVLPPPPAPAGGGGSGGGDSGSGPSPDPAGDPAPVSDTGQITDTAPSGASATARAAFAGVRVASKHLRLVGRYVTVRLRCPAEATGGCAGRTR